MRAAVSSVLFGNSVWLTLLLLDAKAPSLVDFVILPPLSQRLLLPSRWRLQILLQGSNQTDYRAINDSVCLGGVIPIRSAGGRGDVVDGTVDAAHLVDAAGRGALQNLVREREIVGGHAV